VDKVASLKILFLTHAGRDVSTSRLWGFQLSSSLKLLGCDTNINEVDIREPPDIIFITRPLESLILKAHSIAPNAKIGTLYMQRCEASLYKHIDFVIAQSILQEDLILKYKRRVYRLCDFYSSCAKPRMPDNKRTLHILYQGNNTHIKSHSKPLLSALDKLSSLYPLHLTVLVNDPRRLRIPTQIQHIVLKWSEEECHRQMLNADIGVTPGLASYSDLGVEFNFIRTPTRVNHYASYGIPCVSSPIPEILQYYKDPNDILYAVSPEGWFLRLKTLIENESARNLIGQNAHKIFLAHFEESRIVKSFYNVLCQELQQPKISTPISFINDPVSKLSRIINHYSRCTRHFLLPPAR